MSDPILESSDKRISETGDNYGLILDTLDRSNVLLWWANVTLEASDLKWNIRTPPQLRANPIFHLASLADQGSLWHDGQAPDNARTKETALNALSSGAKGYQQEFRIIGTDGIHWLSEEVVIKKCSETEWNLAGIVVDVTERRRMEEQLQHAAKMESVGILAGGIAHDFNNILTVILSNLTLLQIDLADPQAAHILNEAVLATGRASELTHQLLTFAKGGDPIRAAVDLAEVIKEVTTFAIRGSSVKTEFVIPGDLWAADADRGQIGRVIENIVINGSQAMPQGGIFRITASNRHLEPGGHSILPKGDYVYITLSDTGNGISSTDLPRIFDPYFTTKAGGNGLGLAAAFSIIKKHHGHIKVESMIGLGTTFSFWLPASKNPGQAVRAKQEFIKAKSFARILFMDDDAPILRVVEALMKRMGLDCECVADGKKVVETYRKAKEEGRGFALVVMDLTVPGELGGKEAIGLLRAYDPSVKAIVSSGYSSDPVMANFRDYGFCGVISKPYNISELGSVIREHLQDAAGNAKDGVSALPRA